MAPDANKSVAKTAPAPIVETLNSKFNACKQTAGDEFDSIKSAVLATAEKHGCRNRERLQPKAVIQELVLPPQQYLKHTQTRALET
jgi:hypothetical protein